MADSPHPDAEPAGPLRGIRVIEIAGIGPAPFAAMLLADMGADVLRIDRPASPAAPPAAFDESRNAGNRGRRRVALDLKNPAQAASLLDLVPAADVLLEGFRPGVMERLGLGPEVCQARNPTLIYARMTGWGQTGPMAQMAGHDINYFALSGSLYLSGPAGLPCPNLNLVADMGGGGMMMALGITAALLERTRSGLGQIIDAAMVDGVALLATQIHAYRATGRWQDRRAANLIDGGAPFYAVYQTAEGGYIAVGALEPAFYAAFLHGIGLAPADLPAQNDRAAWPALRTRFAAILRTRRRDDWAALFAGTDACVTPVLSPDEAAAHPHLQHRQTFATPFGVQQPMPAPRFSRTPSPVPRPPPAGFHTQAEAARLWLRAAP